MSRRLTCWRSTGICLQAGFHYVYTAIHVPGDSCICLFATGRYVRVLNITDADVLELHQEILSVIPESTIITPDQLRGNASSLKEALIAGGGT